MTDPILKEQCKEMLHKVFQHFGSKAEMARKAGMSVNAISYWFARGQIGRHGAIKYSRLKDLGLSKEQMRPDVKDWTPVKKRKKKV